MFTASVGSFTGSFTRFFNDELRGIIADHTARELFFKPADPDVGVIVGGIFHITVEIIDLDAFSRAFADSQPLGKGGRAERRTAPLRSPFIAKEVVGPRLQSGDQDPRLRGQGVAFE